MTEHEFLQTLEDAGFAEIVVLRDPDSALVPCPHCEVMVPDMGPGNVFQHCALEHPDTPIGQLCRGFKP